MPDLSVILWQPLIADLQWEIRQRARRQQSQIDFYSTGQEEVFSLFRLYLFINDEESAAKLVAVAHERARMMRQWVQMVSGTSRTAQVNEAQRLDELGDSLQRHIGDLGVRASVAPTVSAQVDIEDRIDQLKVLHNDMNKRVPKVEVPIGGATGGAQDGVP